MIHTPAAAVCRASEAQDYKYLKSKDRFCASFVSIAAIRKPDLTVNQDGYANPGDADRMRAKIDAIFRLAIDRGYNSLVLGAAIRHPLSLKCFAMPFLSTADAVFDAAPLAHSNLAISTIFNKCPHFFEIVFCFR
jgi:hypothetical protein